MNPDLPCLPAAEVRDPQFRATYNAVAIERPPVEFHRSTYLLVIGASLLGWVLIVGVAWYWAR